MARPQFSLRAIFAVTTAVAVLSLAIANLGTLSELVEVLGSVVWGFALGGAMAGATIGRTVGRDWIDAALGACFGASGAILFMLAMPRVQ